MPNRVNPAGLVEIPAKSPAEAASVERAVAAREAAGYFRFVMGYYSLRRALSALAAISRR